MVAEAPVELPASAPPPSRWRAAAGWLAAGLLAQPLAQLLGRVAPGALEAWARVATGGVVRVLSRAGALLSFSPGEVAAGLWLGWLVWRAAGGLRAVLRRRRTVRAAVLAGSARLALHLGVLLVAFNLLWGFNYARPGVEEVGRWPAWEGVGPDELEALSLQVVHAANAAYRSLHGVDDLGAPTTLESWPELEAALEEAWARAAPRLPLGAGADEPHGGAFRPWISPLLRRLGVAGMYFPFTGEAWVVAGMPPSLLSNTLAHEKAHQRGVAGEAEAGFLAVIVGSASEHPHARYSAALYAHFQLLGALGAADPEAWRRVAGARLPGVQRDVQDVVDYWNRYRGRARAVRTVVNDAYLRAHGVRAGIADYGRTVQLLVSWARLHGGEVLSAP